MKSFRLYLFLFSLLFARNAFALSLDRDFSHSSLYATLEQLSDDYYALDLQDEEIDSLYNYALEDYKEINPALRKLDQKMLYSYKEKICAIDSAIQKYKIQGLTLYRGLSYLPTGADQVGYTFKQNAYTSTSINRGVAMNFATNKAPYVLDVIKTDQQFFNGIWLNHLSEFDEEEILLARGTSFRVESIEIQKVLDKQIIVRTLSIVEQSISQEIKNIINCQ